MFGQHFMLAHVVAVEQYNKTIIGNTFSFHVASWVGCGERTVALTKETACLCVLVEIKLPPKMCCAGVFCFGVGTVSPQVHPLMEVNKNGSNRPAECLTRQDRCTVVMEKNGRSLFAVFA